METCTSNHRAAICCQNTMRLEQLAETGNRVGISLDMT